MNKTITPLSVILSPDRACCFWGFVQIGLSQQSCQQTEDGAFCFRDLNGSNWNSENFMHSRGESVRDLFKLEFEESLSQIFLQNIFNKQFIIFFYLIII